MRKFNVPFWALSHVFGKYPMYWYRIEQSLGRNSIVGTTIRNPDDIPQHLAADEKHTRILGDKAYVATTVGNQCILGATIANDAGEQSLQDAYQVFKDEAQCLKPAYTPTTVNMDDYSEYGRMDYQGLICDYIITNQALAHILLQTNQVSQFCQQRVSNRRKTP